MHDFFLFILWVLAITGGTTLLIVKMGIEYSSRKRGLTKGATKRELEGIRDDIRAIRNELMKTQESLADVTFMLHDAATPELQDSPDAER